MRCYMLLLHVSPRPPAKSASGAARHAGFMPALVSIARNLRRALRQERPIQKKIVRVDGPAPLNPTRNPHTRQSRTPDGPSRPTSLANLVYANRDPQQHRVIRAPIQRYVPQNTPKPRPASPAQTNPNCPFAAFLGLAWRRQSLGAGRGPTAHLSLSERTVFLPDEPLFSVCPRQRGHRACSPHVAKPSLRRGSLLASHAGTRYCLLDGERAWRRLPTLARTRDPALPPLSLVFHAGAARRSARAKRRYSCAAHARSQGLLLQTARTLARARSSARRGADQCVSDC